MRQAVENVPQIIVEKTGARGKGGKRATRGLNRCVNHT